MSSRWLAAPARDYPDAPALISSEGTLSFRKLEGRALVLAAKLSGAGIGAGDPVAMLHVNHPCVVELIHALILLEAVIVPLNTRLTIGELRGLLRVVQPRVLIFGPGFEAVLQDLSHTLPSLPTLAARDMHGLPEKPTPIAAAPRLDADQAILFTSGSTGRPKGVRLTLANHMASAVGSAERLGTGPGDRWMTCLPLYHIGGLAVVLRGALEGMAVLLEARFDPARVLEQMVAHEASCISLVPTMLERMLDCADTGSRGRFPASLRVVLLGGGRIPEALLTRARAAELPVAPTYGLTEAASQVATLAPADRASHTHSVGRPLPGVTLRIVDGAGRILGPHSVGQILVRGGQVMPGYLGRPEESEHALHDGWLHTGDFGLLDEQGYLSVLNRRSDLIVTGGENVSPAEVEAVLRSHPAVADARVIGREDPRWGQRVHALVACKGRRPPVEALELLCLQRLARFKCPRSFEFVGGITREPDSKLA